MLDFSKFSLLVCAVFLSSRGWGKTKSEVEEPLLKLLSNFDT